ncbi:hypothetical protein BaRGS_00035387 [Batillaria attramentaria]|uniref:Uncharacterized protein n=1 Tax=Batillaria attramentaria TaxID=370345 RepID=A0ABD0JEZ1_9CAEN
MSCGRLTDQQHVAACKLPGGNLPIDFCVDIGWPVRILFRDQFGPDPVGPWPLEEKVSREEADEVAGLPMGVKSRGSVRLISSLACNHLLHWTSPVRGD